TFEGGASFEDYVFSGGGTKDFTVSWTLTVETEPGASIVIRDVNNSIVFSGLANGAGVVAVPLLQLKQLATGRTLHTDHTVTITKAGFDPRVETVTMDRTRTLVAPLGDDEPALQASVAGRHVFYNNSSFDGHLAAATPADDAAIAPDKRALLPGEIATFANYTSYTLGLNGIMIDIDDLPADAVLSAADFAFRVGNDNTPSSWAAAPAPTSITIRRGAGVGGSDRITLVWADNAIQKQWLEVIVRSNANTGLPSEDRFYFGNAVGESGDLSINALVNCVDELCARQKH